MNLEKKAVDIISQVILKVFDYQKDKLSYNREVLGIVKEILPNNKYSILINGALYILSGNEQLPLVLNQEVIVLIPNNNFSNMRIVGGHSGSSSTIV